MEDFKIELYWNDIPIGEDNAITYAELCTIWGVTQRRARGILHELSIYDDGSSFALIRSSNGKGFYRTDNIATMERYRRECLNKGKSILALITKINKILKGDEELQYSFGNNLKVYRTELGLSLGEVVAKMKDCDPAFDKPMLSKMENNVCLPTFRQLAKLSEIYNCEPSELVNVDLFL